MPESPAIDDVPNAELPELESDLNPAPLQAGQQSEGTTTGSGSIEDVVDQLLKDSSYTFPLSGYSAAEWPEGTDGAGVARVADLPDGEFRLEPPQTPYQPSEESVTVRLPIMARAIYDAMRGMGWREGDGGFPQFVWAVLVDWFENVCGYQITVVRRGEIGIERGLVDSRSKSAGPSANAAA